MDHFDVQPANDSHGLHAFHACERFSAEQANVSFKMRPAAEEYNEWIPPPVKSPLRILEGSARKVALEGKLRTAMATPSDGTSSDGPGSNRFAKSARDRRGVPPDRPQLGRDSLSGRAKSYSRRNPPIKHYHVEVGAHSRLYLPGLDLVLNKAEVVDTLPVEALGLKYDNGSPKKREVLQRMYDTAVERRREAMRREEEYRGPEVFLSQEPPSVLSLEAPIPTCMSKRLFANARSDPEKPSSSRAHSADAASAPAQRRGCTLGAAASDRARATSSRPQPSPFHGKDRAGQGSVQRLTRAATSGVPREGNRTYTMPTPGDGAHAARSRQLSETRRQQEMDAEAALSEAVQRSLQTRSRASSTTSSAQGTSSLFRKQSRYTEASALPLSMHDLEWRYPTKTVSERVRQGESFTAPEKVSLQVPFTTQDLLRVPATGDQDIPMPSAVLDEVSRATLLKSRPRPAATTGWRPTNTPGVTY